MPLAFLGAFALLVYLVTCILTTRRLWRAAEYGRGQKLAQTALVWCLPIVGVLLVRGLMAPPAHDLREEGEAPDGDDGEIADDADTAVAHAVEAHGGIDA